MATALDVEHWDGTSWSTLVGVLPGSLWAVAHNDVWLANQQILEWNGTSWINRTPPVAAAGPSYRIWGRSSTDLWASNQTGIPQIVWHWNGSSWADRTPTIVDTTTTLWAVSNNDVWAAAWRQFAQVTTVILLHWTGTQWEEALDLPPGPSGQSPRYVTDIRGTSSHDIWALAGPDLWHFDGTLWSLKGSLAQGVGSLWGSCSNNYWAVSGSSYAHFDGTAWTTGTLTAVPSFLRAVAGSGPDDVWIGGGDAQSHGVVLHRIPGDPAPACGNVRLDPGEQCDPPDGHFCGPDCQRLPVCGDGILEGGETCDPPAGNTCDSFCHLIPTCGNGVLDPGEQCDPPNSSGGSGLLCDANCQRPTCGNGIIDPGEACDPPFASNNGSLWCDSTCQRPTCGNGIIDPGESCDPPHGWQPGSGSSRYCAGNCTVQDACADCHAICDPMAIPFTQCSRQFCRPLVCG